MKCIVHGPSSPPNIRLGGLARKRASLFRLRVKKKLWHPRPDGRSKRKKMQKLKEREKETEREQIEIRRNFFAKKS